MNQQAIPTSVLFTAFLGMTESQIDLKCNNFFGYQLLKTGKIELEANMFLVQYMLSQEQYFELIFDNDSNSVVVAQKTYWDDIDYYYNIMKQKAVPGIRKGYSDGYIVESKHFDEVLFEKISNQGVPDCILTSIEI